MSPRAFKVLEPDNSNCPRCRREGMACKRHKERPCGPWCSGKLSEAERARRQAKGKADAEFARLRRAYLDLFWAGSYEAAQALCKNGTNALPCNLKDLP